MSLVMTNERSKVHTSSRNYDGSLTATGALRTLKKLNRWRKGEIDEWDKRNRTPPPKLMDALAKKVEEVLEEKAREEQTTLNGVNLTGG